MEHIEQWLNAGWSRCSGPGRWRSRTDSRVIVRRKAGPPAQRSSSKSSPQTCQQQDNYCLNYLPEISIIYLLKIQFHFITKTKSIHTFCLFSIYFPDWCIVGETYKILKIYLSLNNLSFCRSLLNKMFGVTWRYLSQRCSKQWRFKVSPLFSFDNLYKVVFDTMSILYNSIQHVH